MEAKEDISSAFPEWVLRGDRVFSCIDLGARSRASLILSLLGRAARRSKFYTATQNDALMERGTLYSRQDVGNQTSRVMRAVRSVGRRREESEPKTYHIACRTFEWYEYMSEDRRAEHHRWDLQNKRQDETGTNPLAQRGDGEKPHYLRGSACLLGTLGDD